MPVCLWTPPSSQEVVTFGAAASPAIIASGTTATIPITAPLGSTIVVVVAGNVTATVIYGSSSNVLIPLAEWSESATQNLTYYIGYGMGTGASANIGVTLSASGSCTILAAAYTNFNSLLPITPSTSSFFSYGTSNTPSVTIPSGGETLALGAFCGGSTAGSQTMVSFSPVQRAILSSSTAQEMSFGEAPLPASTSISATTTGAPTWAGSGLLPSSRSRLPITFDTVGTGAYGSATTEWFGGTWTHNATPGSMIVASLAAAGSSTSQMVGVPTLTYAGTTYKFSGSANYANNANNGTIYFWVLPNVVGGSQTLTLNNVFTGSGKTCYGQANSVSYLNATMLGRFSAATGTSTTPSVSVPQLGGTVQVTAMGIIATGTATTWSSVSTQTSRYQANAEGADYPAFLMGDYFPGSTIGGTIALSATASASKPWAALSFLLAN